MSYYDQEDNVPDTAETILANHDAQIASLDGLVEKTAQQMNEIEQNLGWLYQQAEAAGDQNAITAVNNAWALTQELGTRVTMFDAVRLSSSAMMRKFNDIHQKLASDFEDLEDAIATGDEEHPMLSGFAAGIQEQAWQDMTEVAFEDAYDAAHESVFYDMMIEFHNRVHELTGSDDWGAINRLGNLVLGDDEPTDQQCDLLRQLLATLEQVPAERAS